MRLTEIRKPLRLKASSRPACSGPDAVRLVENRDARARRASGITLTRPPARAAARYEAPQHPAAGAVPGSPASSTRRHRSGGVGRFAGARWVTIAFTWNGLRAPAWTKLHRHVSESSAGMAAGGGPRRHGRGGLTTLGGGLASPDLHAVVISSPRKTRADARPGAPGVRLSIPGRGSIRRSIWSDTPFDHATTTATMTDCRSPRLRARAKPDARFRAPLKPGEFFLGYPTKPAPRAAAARNPSRSGFLAYRRLQSTSAFREFCGRMARPREQE